jgi:glycerol-3-phosphate dehydrogenase
MRSFGLQEAANTMPRAGESSAETYDAAVVGGGVVGCAIARRLTLEGRRVILLEKARDILDGASKGNSGILHTGFDAPPGSLELACTQSGYEEYLAIHERLNLPLIRSGALVLAWTEEEEAALPALMEQARRNGVHDVELLSSPETRALEPELSPAVRASFRVPGESIIDPWSAPHAYLLHALANGASLQCNSEVVGGAFDGNAWRLETTRGAILATIVINAAGLYGDRVDELLTGESHFSIRPRKGQFVVYDKPASALAAHILLPVPGKITKGIVVCRTAYGNLLVGPTAEEQEDRTTATLHPAALRALSRRGEEILPALAGHEVTAIYAGLRPATEFKDYQIRAEPARNYVAVGGIRSTGLSAALGIARHIHGLCAGFRSGYRPLTDPAWPQVPQISEYGQRDWERPGNGGIVCHCERVTRREIEDALSSPLAPGGVGGLKRRTRVTMGRCQGFYCLAEVAALTRDRLDSPVVAGPGDEG